MYAGPHLLQETKDTQCYQLHLEASANLIVMIEIDLTPGSIASSDDDDDDVESLPSVTVDGGQNGQI